MKHKILLLFLLSSFSTMVVYAQREMTWWYFGYNAGFDFTKVLNGETIIPEKVSGPIFTAEGCFSISDYLGNFLMASDGITVFNKDRQVMENGTGLFGDPSAAQSGIIIPRPQYSGQYYIVTVPFYGNTAPGICYSTVDLNQNGGLGKVTEKNKPLNLGGGYSRSDIYENIASVQHSNGIDYWLVHRSRQYFYSWLVTKDGIDPTPVYISDIGVDLGVPVVTTNHVGPGNIKFSKDGKLIAQSGWRGMTLGEFDALSGKITNISSITVPASQRYAYGCEFSPNGKYLYYSRYYNAGVGRFKTDTKLDLQTPTMLHMNYKWHGMQIGPNDRIYSFDIDPSKLALIIIDNPDDGGTNIISQNDYFISADFYRTGYQDVLNLPTFATSTFRFEGLIHDPADICMEKPVTFSVNIVASGAIPMNKIIWDFGDGTTIDDSDFSNPIHTVNHTYKRRGTYTLTITPYQDAISIDEWKISKEIRAKSCRLPVNHNISAMGYYD